MPDWLDRIPNLGVRRVPGVPARNSRPLPGTPTLPTDVRPCSANTLGTPAEHWHLSSIQLKSNAEHKEHREHRKLPRSYWDWRDGLARIDTSRPPAGVDPARWGQLCADASFLFTFFGKAAARLGWAAHDLFGIVTDAPGHGGLIDRLGGERVISMGPDLAHWGHAGEVMQFSRVGATGAAVRPLWEIAP